MSHSPQSQYPCSPHQKVRGLVYFARMADKIRLNAQGLLGEDYTGYFEPGDAPALARALSALRSPGGAQLAKLRDQCAARAHLFDPQAERAALMRWVQALSD